MNCREFYCNSAVLCTPRLEFYVVRKSLSKSDFSCTKWYLPLHAQLYVYVFVYTSAEPAACPCTEH